MTPRELFSNLRSLGPQDASVIFAYIAEHLYEFTLSSGAPLTHCDIMGHKEFWAAVAEAAKVPGFSESTKVPIKGEFWTEPKVTPPAPPPRPQRWDRSCPDCGHEHEGHRIAGRQECGHYLGEGRFCPCESQVTA